MSVSMNKTSSRYESWKTDRPMRKEGFNIGAKRGNGEWVSRHGVKAHMLVR